MKMLFTENEFWTPEAAEVAKEVNAALRPIVERLAEEGYLLRDVAQIIHGEIDMMAVFIRTRRMIARRKVENTAALVAALEAQGKGPENA